MTIIEKTDQYYDNIDFEEYYLKDIERSQFDIFSKTKLNYDSSYFNDKDVCEGGKLDTGSSFNNTVTIIDDALMDSCWPMKSQNRHHTGLSPYNTMDNNGMVKWKYEVDKIESGIAIDDEGVLYFGDFGYYLYAMYPNGSLKWRYRVNEWIWSTPALASDGTVYIGTYGHYLYAINPDGTFKWKFWAGRFASISSSPAIAKDGTIFFGAMGPENNGRIYALYPNGTEKWYYDTGYWIVSDPAIADDGTIYIGSADNYFYAMNPDGTLRWRFKTGGWVKSHPAVGKDGTVYFDSFDDYLYALNPDGSLKWKYHDVGDGSAGAAIDEEGVIYIGGRRLSALYPDGTLKWHYIFGDDKHSGHSSPAISADGTIYIGVTKGTVDGGYIFAINNDGTLKWQKKTANDGCPSSPSIDTMGNVYIGSSSHYLNDGEPYGILYAFGRNDVNQPPEAPVIDGPDHGGVNIFYLFNFTVHDPEFDDIELFVDWGDGNSTSWLGSFDSDMVISLSYSWSERGSYQVRAKARDTYDGSEGDWSTSRIIMPKIYIFNSLQLLSRIVGCFPFFEKILNQII